MPFHIQPLREFLVRPSLPAQISRMSELAYNILWSWEPIIRSVFRRLDPALWRECGYNPVLMLGRVSQATLERAATDPRYLALYRSPAMPTTPGRASSAAPADGKLIAYFSAEYGLTECLPVYSGGLGILSGDHLKSCSDQDYPLIGLGLLYQQGYFRQLLNPDGWQQERYPINDFYTLPLTPVKDAEGQDLKVTVKLPTGNVLHPGLEARTSAASRSTCWTRTSRKMSCRRIATSPTRSTAATSIRACGRRSCSASAACARCKALGLKPTVFHMNEGHSAFLALEQIRRAACATRSCASTRRWRRRAPATSSPPTRPCPPASICSIPA